MIGKNVIYTLVSVIILLFLSVAGIFAFVRIDGKTMAEVTGIVKPKKLESLYSDEIIRQPPSKKELNKKNLVNQIDTLVIEPKPDQTTFSLPPQIPQSVLKKHTFTKLTKFQKPEQSLLKNYKLPVLMYHHIDSGANIPKGDSVGHGLRVGPQIFEKQLEYIQQKGYHTINSDDLYAFMEFGVTLPENPILLTFDDGYKDNVEQALPMLQKYRMIGDFAIITGVVGTGEYMTWEDHKTLLKAGNSISSHTVNHCYLAINVNSKTGSNGPFQESPINDTPGQFCPSFLFGGQLNTGQIRGELAKSKDDLEKNLGITIHFLVYPFGKYNKQVMEIAKETGYTMAVTVEPQVDEHADLADNAFDIHRIRMNGQQVGEIDTFLD
jgi:peptidoglycan/xylan/chitin deacetylase (PgdA/CDA1 family)